MASLLIDDFSAGTYNVALTSGNDTNYQNGSTTSIIGGKRMSYLTINSDFNQQPGATLDIRNGRLILDTGVRVTHGLVIGYGYDDTLPWRYFPLNLDLSLYSRFQINFNFLQAVQGDNFNIQVATEGGTLEHLPRGGFSQAGISSLPMGTTPYTVDLLFESFVGIGPVAGAAADFHKIDTICLLFSGYPVGGASDFAISSIECV